MNEEKEIKKDHPDQDKKEVTVFVNSEPYQVPKADISYTAVVTLGFSDFPQHPERNYSVKYRRGDGDKPEGILSPGTSVKVKDKMIFDVWFTGES